MKMSLLHDVLSEGDYAAFRDALVAKVEAEARRKRSRRRQLWLGLAASIVVAVGSVLSLPIRVESPHSPRRVTASLPQQILHTQASSPSQLLMTKKAEGILLETRHFENLAFTPDRGIPLVSINDTELMALFPDQARGFVAASGRKRFVCIDPADGEMFMSSN